jgi:ABC-type uncharacterized transport system involved in gliding motility auxiliary subunit
MRVASIILGVIGGVVLLTSLLTLMFFPLDSFMLWGKLSLGLGMLLASLVFNWENVKEGVNKKNTVFVISSVVMAVAMVGVLGAINYVAQSRKQEWDLTKDKVFTLSDQTQKLLRELTDDVVVTAFYRKDESEGAALEDLVGRYRVHTAKLHLELVNPETHPDQVEKHKITEQSARILVEARGQEARIKDITEEALTNAIIQVSQKEKKKLYVLAGHGEAALDNAEATGLKATAEDLGSEGYTVATVSLVENLAVPADAAALLIIGQKGPLLDPEVKVVKEFLDKGGRVLLLAEPGVRTGLEEVVKSFGLELGNNTVMDASEFGRLLGQGPDSAIIAEFAEHQTVKDLNGSVVVLKSARSVTQVDAPGATVTLLGKSNARSWGETSVGAGEYRWDIGELRGPVPVMAVSTRAVNAPEGKRSDEARLIVVGDADLANNQYRAVASNRDLLLNLVAFAAEAEDKISIRPKTRSSSRIHLGPGEASLVAFFALDVMPVSLLSLGLAVWLVRRRR